MSGHDYRAICDVSGFKCWRSQMRKRWDGLLVRKDFWEPRQPQDFIEPRREEQYIPDSRPDTDPVYLTPPADYLVLTDGSPLLLTSGGYLNLV